MKWIKNNAQRYEVFYDKFCSIDDGNASQEAVEAVLNKGVTPYFYKEV